MTSRRNSFLFLKLFFASAFAISHTLFANPTTKESTKDLPKAAKKLSSVEMQWEEAKDAVKYQVQVFNSKKKFLRTFESKSSLLKFKSTSGQVKIRGRYLDGYGKYSEWSDLIDIDVPPEAVEFTEAATSSSETIKPIEVQASNKSMKAKINLQWKAAAQAKKYKVKIYDENKNLVQEHILKDLSFTAELEAGKYTFSITSIGNDEIAGKESPAPRPIFVKSAQLSDIPFALKFLDKNHQKFKIQIPHTDQVVVLGKLEYSHHMVDKWIVVEDISKATDYWAPSPDLKPGKYKISFWGSKQGWQDSGVFTHEFIIKPKEKDLKDIIN
jgi:hypothetical protein